MVNSFGQDRDDPGQLSESGCLRGGEPSGESVDGVVVTVEYVGGVGALGEGSKGGSVPVVVG